MAKILLSNEIIERLNGLKNHPDELLSDVIRRLIEIYIRENQIKLDE